MEMQPDSGLFLQTYSSTENWQLNLLFGLIPFEQQLIQLFSK